MTKMKKKDKTKKKQTNNNLRQFFSSSPLEQSFIPSHTDVARRHPLSLQLNMLEGHSQFSSSEPSLQAKSPSHNRFFLTHSPLLHVNLSSLHLKPGRKSWKVCFYSRPAGIQIHWSKGKYLHKKSVQLPQDWLETPNWPTFHCLAEV